MSSQRRARSSLPVGQGSLFSIEDTTEARVAGCPGGEGVFASRLSKRSQRDFLEMLRFTLVAADEVVFMEGQIGKCVHFLLEGRAKLLTTNSEGKTLILKIAEKKEILGLHSILAGRPYEITVETLEKCRIGYLSRDEFLRFLEEHADACLEVAKHLGRDCHVAYDVIRSIGYSSVQEKLARFLVECAEAGRPTDRGVVSVKLPLTREEIAQRIGCSRETVSRALSGFKRQRLVELSGATLVVHDRAGLESLAAN
jgi:CRP/FNR family transcriptional regulator, cyclic AMP receptor protein